MGNAWIANQFGEIPEASLRAYLDRAFQAMRKSALFRKQEEIKRTRKGAISPSSDGSNVGTAFKELTARTVRF